MSRPFDAVKFIEEQGIVLASAKGHIPNLADAVAGEAIRGSWWGHPSGKQIYDALRAAQESPHIVALLLYDGKITFVHRRLWPALVRLVDELGRTRLAVIRQEHMPTGVHRNRKTPFPKWVPPQVMREAQALSAEDAHALVDALLPPR
jgi:hypothetical protein